MMPFPTPPGAKWEDVCISIFKNEFANIRVGDVSRKNIHYRQMGFPIGKTYKNSISPGQLWLLLNRFALSPDNSLPDRSSRMGLSNYSKGKTPSRLNQSIDSTKAEWYYDDDRDRSGDDSIDTYDPHISTFSVGAENYLPKTLKVGVSRMRKILKRYFAIMGDPIYKYDKREKCYKTKFKVTISFNNNPTC